MGSYAGYLVETFVTLLAVCGLAFVVLFGARRLGIGRPRGPIQLVGQLPLDARRAIYLVQVGGQVLVVGASEAGITRLGEIPLGDLPAPEAPSNAPFGGVLARVLGNAKPKISARPAAAAKPPAVDAPAVDAPAEASGGAPE
jgi:flagellar biogenesis protein FliO